MRIGGIELQSVVTSIGEEDVPASAFEIPAGYKEVPSPAGKCRRIGVTVQAQLA